MVYYFSVEYTEQDKNELDDFLDGGAETINKSKVYMGKDKIENEVLLKHSQPKYIWFHVDNYSSAHLYLECSAEQQSTKFEILKLNEELLVKIGQITKANSIKGNKANDVKVIYTPVDNLRSDGSMDTGTVSFVNPQKVKRIHIQKRDNGIINKINKTKYEISTDEFVQKEKEKQILVHSQKKQMMREKAKKAKSEKEAYFEQKKRNEDPYADLFTAESVTVSSNENRDENWVEEDFW